MYEPRTYRDKMIAEGLVSFRVVIKETDLHISACRELKKEAEDAVRKYRQDLEGFIVKQPVFLSSLKPLDVPPTAPHIVKRMSEAAQKADVGPMAAVAGAIAELVGKELEPLSREIIVENGGDIFIHTLKFRTIAIFAGDSPLSNRVGIEISPEQSPLGVCASAGKVGHSLSFGSAEAVVVLSKDTALADAAATSIGNKVRKVADIEKALNWGKTVDGILGIIVIKEDQVGAWGDLKLIPFSEQDPST